jgi:hypothetical protein
MARTSTNSASDNAEVRELLGQISRLQGQVRAGLNPSDPDSPPPPAYPSPGYWWRILKVWAALVFSGVIYWTVISQGIRSLLDVGRRKFCDLDIPGASWLAHWNVWHRLGVAHLLAVGLMLVVYYVFTNTIRALLFGEDGHGERIQNAEANQLLFFIGTLVFLFVEPILFFYGLRTGGARGRGGPPDFILFVFSLGYLFLIVFVCHWKVLTEKE